MSIKTKKTLLVRHKSGVLEKAGDILINMGQIVFGTIFLGGVLERKVPSHFMLIGGIVVAFLLFGIGLVFYAKNQKDKE